MSYVLGSLVDEKDKATPDADLLARRLEERIAPRAFHKGASPNHTKVAADAEATGSVGVLFGHNGSGTLRAVEDKKVRWADGPELAEMFREGRVYVFACKTVGDDLMNPLGNQAVASGIRVFVGHDASIAPPDSSHAQRPEFVRIQDCSLAMICAFLDGCDEEGALRTAGWNAYDALENGIGLAEDSPGFVFWLDAVTVQQLAKSLRVLKRS